MCGAGWLPGCREVAAALKVRPMTRLEVAKMWLALRLSLYVLQAEGLLDRLLGMVFKAPPSARQARHARWFQMRWKAALFAGTVCSARGRC